MKSNIEKFISILCLSLAITIFGYFGSKLLGQNIHDILYIILFPITFSILLYQMYIKKDEKSTSKYFLEEDLQSLSKINEIDIDLLKTLKKVCGCKFTQFKNLTYIPPMIIRGYVAIFNIDPENKRRIEEIVKVVGATDKYQLLRSSMNHEDLFIIMSIKNKLSIIRDFELSGNDHEISNEKIHYKFSEWDEKYGIRILGISFDWIKF
jgi:hypothetical protein